jgi:apolipoprotein N-acyltransferase
VPHDENIISYAKMQLVPFGERVPYQDSFPFKYIVKFLDALEMGQGNWSPGKKVTIFPLATEGKRKNKPNIKPAVYNDLKADTTFFAAPICYESVFPELIRKFVARGAEFLVIITNDAWFGRAHLPEIFSGGLFQHAQIATFRAIENRIEIARCANTGVTTFIDSFGRMRKSTQIFEEAVIVDNVALRSKTTFYTRYGNVFSYMVSSIAVLTIIYALFSRVSARNNHN